jgi:hypothetical protein
MCQGLHTYRRRFLPSGLEPTVGCLEVRGVDVSDAFMEQDVQASDAVDKDRAGGRTEYDPNVAGTGDTLPELDEITGIHGFPR